MHKWNRTFWGRKRGTDAAFASASACEQAEACLTAVFDGEADAASIASARGHLKSCESCAHRWEEWEKTRVLLRSVPAPEPPSPLLTRVLLSCRLLSSVDPAAEQAAIAQSENEAMRAALAAYLESPDQTVGDAMLDAAPLARYIATVPVPPQLQNQILQRTTGAPKPVWNSLLPSARAAVRDWSAAWSTPRPVRWGMGLAVPALAAWLIFAGQTEYPTVPQVAPAAPPVAVAPKNSAKTKPGVATPPRPAAVERADTSGGWLKPLKGAIKRAADSLPSITMPQKPPSSAVVVAQSPVTAPDVESRAVPVAEAPRASVRTVSVAGSGAKLPLKKVKDAIRNAVRLPSAQTRPAVDIVENARVRIVNAATTASSGRPSFNRIRRSHSPAQPQISVPETSPPARLAKLTELDFEEAFIAVTSIRDDRPEDVRQALDEFRNAVLSEHSEDEEEFEE